MVDGPSDQLRFTSGLPSPLQTSPEASSKRGTKRDHDFMRSEESQKDSQKVKKHDPTADPLPKMATNHPSFHSAEQIAASIPEDIIRVIRDNPYTDEDFEYLKEMASNVGNIHECGEIKIGLKGDSGTGKSSLINSLLGHEGIAPSGNFGEACTAVVQEFRKPRPSQQMPCEAEIIFLLPQAREAALRDWVRSAWDSCKSGADEDEDKDQGVVEEDIDIDQEVQEGEGSVTATDAILSLFRDHEECASEQAIKHFLSAAASREDSELLGQLKCWTDTLFKSLGVESSALIVRAPTPESLRDELAQFLAHVNRDIPSPWPLVELVKCYFDCPLLSQGVVIADLPGTSDINRIRVQTTSQYMKKVDHTGVVAHIDRAQSNAAANKTLVECYKRKRGKNVFMALTKSDSEMSDHDLATKYINMPGANAGDVKKLLLLDEELRSIRLDLRSVEDQRKQAISQRNLDPLDELDVRTNDLDLELIRETCVEIRNNKVRQALVDRHLTMMKQETLPVFCVSSSEYMKHVVGIDKYKQATMSVEATEIPKLRAYIYSLPADRKILAFKHHVKYKLPSLVNNLAMSCSQSKLKRREELRKILMESQTSIQDDISQVFKNLFSVEVLTRLSKIKKNKALYSAAAREKLKIYAKRTFCRNKGKWKTKTVGSRDWNAEMLEPLIKDMKVDLRPWEDVSEALGRDLSEKVVGALRVLIERMQDSAGPSQNVLQPFFAEMRLQVDLLDESCKSEAQEVENGLCSIRDRILLAEDHRDAYFLQALEKTYAACATMSGNGVSKKRIATLGKKISQKGPTNPFHNCHEKAKGAAQKLIQLHTESFTNKVLHTFQQFHETFTRLFKIEENDAPEAKALRDQLRGMLPAFRARISECERLIQESLDDSQHN
ncbi:hypothetical protein SLS58_000067 [Diplodia intermedia]|uniref:Nuclear GTPase SLIP-GC n=1 Tax=Diplodia intermedia TaxID=856260 RepID=A0ABR3U569_9PEZI